MSNRKFRRNSYKKKTQYKKIFIFSEGKNTEVEYFKAIGDEVKSGLRIKDNIFFLSGGNGNTLGLVKHIIGLINNSESNKPNILRDKGYDLGDEIWAVFDKDEFPDDDYNNAITLAKKNGINVAYSNECFELWFLLHFESHVTQQKRNWYYKKLSDDNLLGKLVGKNYEPDGKKRGMGKKIYEFIKGKEDKAMQCAKKLEKENESEFNFVKRNPYTSVYKLVESIRNINNQSSS